MVTGEHNVSTVDVVQKLKCMDCRIDADELHIVCRQRRNGLEARRNDGRSGISECDENGESKGIVLILKSLTEADLPTGPVESTSVTFNSIRYMSILSLPPAITFQLGKSAEIHI